MTHTFCDNPTHSVTRDILKKGHLKNEPFFLVDVGASGGIGKPWQHLGKNLKAIAIDPLVNECQRLQKNETRPMVQYTDAFIVAEKDTDQLAHVSEEMSQFYQRSSYETAAKIKSFNFIKEEFNSGAELVYSKNKVTLNNLLGDEIPKINFLKVDTDGFDISVLKGADKILSSPNLVGVLVECQFLGTKGRDSNVFSNIERYLADFDFHVFNMDVNRYSRHHLPSRFTYNLYAQTDQGQTLWADVLFMKDPLKQTLTTELAYKYLIVHELFNLQDCAAELLLEKQELFDSKLKNSYLDLLANQFYGNSVSYETALKKFRENPEFYFPNNYSFFCETKLERLIKAAAPFFPKTFKNKIKSILTHLKLF